MANPPAKKCGNGQVRASKRRFRRSFPQSGHEQKGRRPALVISNYLFNKHTGLAIACPITSTDRKIPFHLPVPASCSLTGFVMVEQVKSIDYLARKAKFIERAPDELVEDVLAVFDVCTK